MDYSKIKLDFNIQQVSPADLLLLENLASLKYTAYNLIENLDWDGMLLFADSLEKKLSEITPTNEQDKYIHTILMYWILRLRLFSYGSLRSNQKADLFKKSLVPMLSMGLDPKRTIFKFLDIFDSPDIITQETAGLLADLNSSQEYLGDPKKFSLTKFIPTVSNWLKEYQIILTSSGVKIEAGAFHIVKYMDSNQNVKFLNAGERDVLQELLDLYNSLLNPIVYVDEKELHKAGIYTNSQQFALPLEILRPTAASSLQVKMPPVVPAPKNMRVIKPMSDMASAAPKKEILDFSAGKKIEPAAAQEIKKNFVAEPRIAKAPESLAGRPAAPQQFSRMNIQDLLKSQNQALGAGNNRNDTDGVGLKNFPRAGGLSQNSLKNPDFAAAKPPGQPGRESKQQEIDKKLEELKKKIE